MIDVAIGQINCFTAILTLATIALPNQTAQEVICISLRIERYRFLDYNPSMLTLPHSTLMPFQ